jgi:pimeloyl-ACP methyl ester carboxylesterase
MSACTVPTLIIHGEKDQGALLELCGRRTAQAIPQSQLKVYEGAAHGLFLTHRDRLTNDLLEFIGSGSIVVKDEPIKLESTIQRKRKE